MELVEEARQQKSAIGNGFFLWAIVLLLLTGACIASWMGSFYVMDHPEKPECYRILKRLKRIDPPKRFPVVEAPKGEFLGPAKLLDRYGKLGPAALEHENAMMLRDYLRNYRESRRRVPYLAGKFQVTQSYPLQKSDLFPSGAVAVAQVENMPQLLVEFVFPAAPANVAKILEVVTMGADISLQRSHDLWALIHVQRHADGRLQFTAVPLPYGGWQLKKGEGNFTLQSPEELMRDYQMDLILSAGFPIVRDPRLSKGLAEHKQFRRKILANSGDDQAALSGPELVRFEPKPADDGKISIKEQDAARAKGAPVSAASGTAGRALKARPLPTPAPAVPLPPRPIVRNKPPTNIIGASAPTVAPTEPEKPAVPPPPTKHRAISTAEASALVEKYSSSEPAVLSGDFVVTGVLGRRIALRTREALRDPAADPTQVGNSAALIVVDFPEGVPAPEKDATVTRDAEHGFAIRDVIRGRNGQITIVAAEREPQ